jgi:predicted transcriptional regulator
MSRKKKQVGPLDLSDDLVVRVAAEENGIRREMAKEFEEARIENNLSIADLAHNMETSRAQVRRLLHKEVGGVLELKTILRAADVLGFYVDIHLEGKVK